LLYARSCLLGCGGELSETQGFMSPCHTMPIPRACSSLCERPSALPLQAVDPAAYY
jgi:hypothetical protein